MTTPSDAAAPAGTSVSDTLQSLLVAFVMAMTFRGFFVEGFVIPTGSMAPTLMGQHVRFRSPETAYEFPIDAGPVVDAARAAAAGVAPARRWRIYDPMLGFEGPVEDATSAELLPQGRMGDRVLVLKFLYPFSAPSRWDVVVFKNPTDPVGDTQNYIKRLVGLPNETLLLADGDVFTGAPDADPGALRIQRKPEHIQRAVWQPVHDSDFVPTNLEKLEQNWRRVWAGAPWRADAGSGWKIGVDRVWSCDRDAPSTLTWDWSVLPIDDRVAYNMFRPIDPLYPVSDLRVAAAVAPESPEAFETSLELGARSHVFRFAIGNGEASLEIRHAESPDDSPAIERAAVPLDGLGPGTVDLEFWHVDQAMSIWIDGEEIVRLEYDWNPLERIDAAFFGRTLEDYRRDPVSMTPTPPTLRWNFAGSPVDLRRVRVDRDLYYRPMRMGPTIIAGPDGERLPRLGFGNDIDDPARLDDDQFLMLGDNSGASRDSRVLGFPHPLAALRTGESRPFVVPGSMLLGKAWCVYFPAPLPYAEGSRALVPDFGRLRFIR
ncbi:MAG: S26 family signal peptidase [Phycisphaerales bacterium]